MHNALTTANVISARLKLETFKPRSFAACRTAYNLKSYKMALWLAIGSSNGLAALSSSPCLQISNIAEPGPTYFIPLNLPKYALTGDGGSSWQKAYRPQPVSYETLGFHAPGPVKSRAPGRWLPNPNTRWPCVLARTSVQLTR
jgi:hypothetical protein